MGRRFPLLLLAVLASLPGALAWCEEPGAAGIAFFEAKIRPILVKHCYECHSDSAKVPQGKLLLDTREGLLKGGESGILVVPGKVEASLLLQALHYQKYEMPPDGKLPAETIADFEKWVKMGLPDPRDGKSAGPKYKIDFAAGRKFWSLQPLTAVEPPAAKSNDWIKNDIDRFILAKLEAAGLKPSAPANRTDLLRRATFDMIGLPPTPAEIDAFLKDQSPDAFMKVVERLLASPHYGERWGRHWLDVARFGEDQAHTFQARMYPNAFRYRDWVVNSLNKDLPYNQFLMAQIAGDLLEGGDTATAPDRAAALGLFALGPVYYADNNAAKQAQADEWDDRVDTLTRGMLGLTVACARCHDHKFDPITTQDYYALAGIFASSNYAEFSLATAEDQAKKQAANDRLQAQQKTIDEFLDAAEKSLRPARAKEIAKYLAGVWNLTNRRVKNAGISTADSAKKDNLNEALLRKWRDYLNGPGKNQPALATWHDLVAKLGTAADLSEDAEAVAEIGKAADAFQQQLVALLEAKQPSDNSEQAKQDATLVEQILGAKGVVELPRNEVAKLLNDEQKKELKPSQDKLVKLKSEVDAIKLPVAHSLVEGTPIDLKVFAQGNPAKPGELAARGFLTVLSPDAPLAIPAKTSGRLQLAQAIASATNPLTPRVAVNRVWQGHFGQGLVRTLSNFGTLGDRPSHPELLDYLARSFVDSGWSLKSLHRQILLSATYQQTSRSDAARDEADAENRWLSHMPRRRLEVEPWRDAMLAASGTLDLTLGGPSTNFSQGDFRRRSLYGYVSRHQLNELLRLFDFPDPNITSDRRSVTTVPLQQLFVLNSDFLTQQAKALAARVKKEATTEGAPLNDRDGIQRVYTLVFGRTPTDREVTLGETFLSTKPAGSLSAWEEYTLALLGSNEFAFID